MKMSFSPEKIHEMLWEAYERGKYERVMEMIRTTEISGNVRTELLCDALLRKNWVILEFWEDFNLSNDEIQNAIKLNLIEKYTFYDLLKIRELFGELVKDNFYFKVYLNMLYNCVVDLWQFEAVALYGGKDFHKRFSEWLNARNSGFDVYSIIKKYGIKFTIDLVNHGIIHKGEIMYFINREDNSSDYVFARYVLYQMKRYLGTSFIDETITHFIEQFGRDSNILKMLIELGAKSSKAPDFNRYEYYVDEKDMENLFDTLRKVTVV